MDCYKYKYSNQINSYWSTKTDQTQSFLIYIRVISISNTNLILLELLTNHISFYISIK